MPLKCKKNLFLISAVLLLGQMTVVQADECGTLRYLSNKSNGVAISGNTCNSVDDIALGSEFNLSPGARLWFKATDAGLNATQGICQNRSATPIRIRVDSDQLPWIKPTDVADCSAWAANKMTCGSALSCVIATAGAGSTAPEERTTSVRMRTVPLFGDSDKTEPPQNNEEDLKQSILSAMQPDVNLCRAINPANPPVKFTWQVDTSRQVNKLNSTTEGRYHADQAFIGCLTAIIKDFSYPPLSQAIWLSNQF
ncbi:MAG: hypothetical protein Q7U38_00805 [Methylobacter sp.]|nr:hypothetical protein [Methylobacter sp.]MDP2099758.1 hypothetical protein [Methylobacter sp.]MDP2427942.1 hypothetical protein [Methylobacter sp.]MDP3055837.1 hypothetical protein [Methylobacter sp.]MDP3361664.1 hypothetical protein [Methylobacter sp.]